MQCVFRCRLQQPSSAITTTTNAIFIQALKQQHRQQPQQKCHLSYLSTISNGRTGTVPRIQPEIILIKERATTGREPWMIFSRSMLLDNHSVTMTNAKSLQKSSKSSWPPLFPLTCLSPGRTSQGNRHINGRNRSNSPTMKTSNDCRASDPLSWWLSSFWTAMVQNGNPSRQSFYSRNTGLNNKSTVLFGYTFRLHQQPQFSRCLKTATTQLSRYHTYSPSLYSSSSSGGSISGGSNSSNVITTVDSLQTWRRPFRSLPSAATSESRSLATMPTKPTQAMKGTVSGTAADPVARLQRSLAAVPHHTIKNEIKLRCTEFDHKGNVKTTAGEFLKSDLCQKHGLHARDLRKIDSSFNNQIPVILVRPEAILVNVGHIRALIKADLVVLFDSFGSTDSYNQSIFIYDLEEKLRMSTSAAGGLPFEFRALEAIFISVLSSLQSEMEVLVHFVTNLLAQLEESIDQNKLKELLQYSKKLSQFESKTLLIRDVFVEVLDQDEDLANMYLTEKKLGHPRTVDSHEEIEILLESYLKQVEEIANTVAIVKQQMQSTEEIVNVILGATRNQLLLFELRIAMGTLGMSSGAIIASLYGMNLHNYLETNPHAFAIVGTTALGISMMVFTFCSRKLKQLAKGTT